MLIIIITVLLNRQYLQPSNRNFLNLMRYFLNRIPKLPLKYFNLQRLNFISGFYMIYSIPRLQTSYNLATTKAFVLRILNDICFNSKSLKFKLMIQKFQS